MFDLYSNTSIDAFGSSLSFCPESDQTPGSILYAQYICCDRDNRVDKHDARNCSCSCLNETLLFYEAYRGVSSIGAENRDKQYYMNNTKTFRH